MGAGRRLLSAPRHLSELMLGQDSSTDGVEWPLSCAMRALSDFFSR